jgi:hypothetical protein
VVELSPLMEEFHMVLEWACLFSLPCLVIDYRLWGWERDCDLGTAIMGEAKRHKVGLSVNHAPPQLGTWAVCLSWPSHLLTVEWFWKLLCFWTVFSTPHTTCGKSFGLS